jgi:hypothetical protein
MNSATRTCAWLSAAVVLTLALPSPVHAQVFRCETDSGVPLYQNTPGPRCKPMDLPVITTIPGPARQAPAPAGAGASVNAPRPQTGAGQGAGSAAGSPANGAAAGFPRVETPVQRSRDQDRRRILEDELRKEEARFAELRSEFNSGEPERRGDERNYQKYLDRVQRLKDDMARSESAMASLRREISALRD